MESSKTIQTFPALDIYSMTDTRDALHAYSRVLGSWLKTCRPSRKHWWHASLRPSLMGLTTGVMHAGIDFELELNLGESLFVARTSSGEELKIELDGQSAASIADAIQKFLRASGVDENCVPESAAADSREYVGYSSEHAYLLSRAINAVAAALEIFRGEIHEETSPIQLWSHHFDLSMLWLPGEKIPGQDPENEEYSDKQMNFGFTFGDDTIAEPYFYVTAYPLPDTLPKLQLPAGTQWQSEGFNAAILLYQDLVTQKDSTAYLVKLWRHLLTAGREQMLSATTKGQKT
jgi:hypothetical protein